MTNRWYISLLLYAEGPSDYRFLVPVLRRLTERLCCLEARGTVDIGDVIGIEEPRKYRDHDRATRILEAARSWWSERCILFIHADGAGDPVTKAAEQIEPGARLVARELRGEACVAVVPVREIEAWTLVDGIALRSAFGTTLDDQALRIAKRPRDVEGILDPKLVLSEVFREAAGPSERRRVNVVHFYDRIGERVDLERLEQVPAFKKLREDLRRALGVLGVLG